MDGNHWHSLPLSDVEKRLATDFRRGLDDEEVLKRRASYGPNELPRGKRDSHFLVFLRQFRSSLVYVLLIASVIVYAIGEHVDAAIILFVLIFNAIVGMLQEGKAENTLAALKTFTRTQATVLRSGKDTIIDGADIVPGDIMLLGEGERIPADGRLIKTRALGIDESALTGESIPVHKEEKPVRRDVVNPAEMHDMVFKGTLVIRGRGSAVAVATGIGTEIGKISETVSKIDTDIPLKADVRRLSFLIVWVVLGVSILLFAQGVSAGATLREMFAVVVSLAVSVVPEGLPVVLTLILATGMWRMAKQNALVKRLNAVEGLGQARVIAVDKTGTITRNELLVRTLFIGGRFYDIGGTGYDPHGVIRHKGNDIDPLNHPDVLLAGKIAAFVADARISFISEPSGAVKKNRNQKNETPGQWRVTGDPTDAAMLVFAEKIGFKKKDLEGESPLVYEEPFDYVRKYHLTAHRVEGALGRDLFVAVAGAPEVIMARSDRVVEFDPGTSGYGESALDAGKRKHLVERFESMSAKGHRVLGFAFNEISKEMNPSDTKMIFGGFFGMVDGLRPEVAGAMQAAHDAGVKVVMITGDHKVTAIAIAREAGIFNQGDEALTGEELDALTSEELSLRLPRVSVFARVTPEDKMKIINGYKRLGDIVAMTGDGVNDAPSLVAADLGVAMGTIGTEVAKEAADIILLDDNFGSIVAAIEEGRSIYKTIKKVILFLFSTNVGEIITITGALFLGFPLPLRASQIIWLNLVTDGFLTVALGMEPKEKGLLKQKFKKPTRLLVDGLMTQRIITMSVPIGLGTIAVFAAFYGDDLVKGWTMAMTTLAIFQWVNAWNCRSETKSIFSENPFANRYLVWALAIVVGLQILAVHTPFMNALLRTTPLSLAEWGIAMAVSLLVIAAEELRKFIYRRFTLSEKAA